MLYIHMCKYVIAGWPGLHGLHPLIGLIICIFRSVARSSIAHAIGKILRSTYADHNVWSYDGQGGGELKIVGG